MSSRGGEGGGAGDGGGGGGGGGGGWRGGGEDREGHRLVGGGWVCFIRDWGCVGGGCGL